MLYFKQLGLSTLKLVERHFLYFYHLFRKCALVKFPRTNRTDFIPLLAGKYKRKNINVVNRFKAEQILHESIQLLVLYKSISSERENLLTLVM